MVCCETADVHNKCLCACVCIFCAYIFTYTLYFAVSSVMPFSIKWYHVLSFRLRRLHRSTLPHSFAQSRKISLLKIVRLCFLYPPPFPPPSLSLFLSFIRWRFFARSVKNFYLGLFSFFLLRVSQFFSSAHSLAYYKLYRSLVVKRVSMNGLIKRWNAYLMQ